MARLIAKATGNFTSSGTWASVNAATAAVTEGGVTRVALTTTSQNSSSFMPTSAVTIDAVAIKVCDVGGTTGSVTLVLYNVTTTASVVSLTIPIADLPQGTSNASGSRAGWVLFATGTQNLTSGSNYQVRLSVTSGASTVGVLTTGTATNWQRMLRTTTAAAPAAADDLFVLGLWTASATWTTYTVTMDSTSSATTYGSNPSGGTAEERSGLIIGKSTLTWGNVGSTNYALKLAGMLVIGPAGTMNMGTSGSPCDRTSTMTLTFATTTLFRILLMVGGTCNVYGQSRTTAKDINWTYLTSDMTSGSSTTASVAHDTGWLNADGIYIAATTLTATQSAPYTLSTGSTTSISLTGAVSAAYSGTAILPALVVLTSYLIDITSDNSAREAGIAVYNTGVLSGQWFRITHGGLEYASAVTGAQTLRYVCLHNLNTLAGARLNIGNVTHSGTWSIRDLVSICQGNINTIAITPGSSAVVTSMTFQDLISVNDSANTHGIAITSGPYAALTGIKAYGAAMTVTAGTFTGTWTVPSTFLSNSWILSPGAAVVLPQLQNCTITDLRASAGSTQSWASGLVDITFESCYVMSSGTAALITFGTATRWYNVLFSNCSLGAYAFLAGASVPTDLVAFGSAQEGTLDARFLNCTFDNAAINPPTNFMDIAATGEVGTPVDLTVNLVSCLGAFTALARISSGTPYLTRRSYIYAHRYNQASGDHRIVRPFYANGKIETDATTYNTAAPSEKLTPLTASYKLESTVKRFAVASGGTATVTAYVRKSAAYNGAAPRLMVRRNDAAGIATDTVGDTHTAAADTWEQLTYTTGAVTDDCVVEAYVDGDGTAGVVYVDDWAAS